MGQGSDQFTVAMAILVGLLLPAAGSAEVSTFSTADIQDAQYAGGDLPPGRSALTAKLQVLLDRSGTSPGVIDGYKGGMSESAIMAFERRAGLPIDGKLDPQVWQLLLPYSAQPVTISYTITNADAEGLVAEIPQDYAEKALMPSMGYTSVSERLSERFHMDEKFIAFLNPGIALQPGATINVTTPAKPLKSKVTRIIVDKASRRVAAYDAGGNMIVDYPATVGSDTTPSPSGVHKVVTVALNPNYTYNPAKNFKQGNNDKALVIPPGPNGPVGEVWIDLTKPTYGIHGTPTPSLLFRNQSYGCVRLTNWDVKELAGMVIAGQTTVEFLEPGVTIAQVTSAIPPAAGAATQITTPASFSMMSSRHPLPRPARFGQPAIPATMPGPLPDATATTAPMATMSTPAAPVQAVTDPLATTSVAPQTGTDPAMTVPVAPIGEPLSDPLSEALFNALPSASPAPAPDEANQ